MRLHQRAEFVAREIVPGARTYQQQDFLQITLARRFQIAGFQQRRVGDALIQAGGDGLGAQYRVGQARLGGAAGHGGKLRRLGVLHHHHAARRLDGLNARRAVAAHARQNHAHRLFALRRRQTGQKGVDDIPLGFLQGHQSQRPAAQLHAEAGRGDVDVIGLQRQAVGDGPHLQHRAALQDFGHHAFLARIEVRNHHKGHLAAQRQSGEEALVSVQRPRRAADAHNGAEQILIWQILVWRILVWSWDGRLWQERFWRRGGRLIGGGHGNSRGGAARQVTGETPLGDSKTVNRPNANTRGLAQKRRSHLDSSALGQPILCRRPLLRGSGLACTSSPITCRIGVIWRRTSSASCW